MGFVSTAHYRVNNSYLYSSLHGESSYYEHQEHGSFLVGEHFIVIKEVESGKIASFVLDGARSSGESIYRCVYSDFEDNE